MSKELYNFNLYEELIQGCKQGYLNSAKYLIRMANIRLRDEYGRTIFFYAAKEGSSAITQLLIEEGADVNAPCTSESKWTPLHYAAQHRYFNIVRIFLEHGADINAKDSFGATPLHCATRFSGYCDAHPIHSIDYYSADADLNLIGFLVAKGANVNTKDIDNRTPLHDATRFLQDSSIVGLFLRRGADINATDKDGITPLHDATRFSGDLDLIEFLVRNGADVNAKDKDGKTPLHDATRFSGDLDLIKFLVRNGADVNAKDKDGKTPLDYLPLSHENTERLELLIENGAIVTEEMLTTQRQKGNTSPHPIAAFLCQNALIGQIDEILSDLGEGPISLLAKIMRGQLVEGGSIETLNRLLDIDNPTIKKIIQSDDFFGKTTEEIIEKHAARLYNSILSGKVHDTPNLDTFTKEEQDMVVNQVKLLCNENEDITITNEKLSKVLESNNLPDHMREEFHKLLCHNEEVLLANMEEASEAVKDEALLQIEAAAGTYVEISNNHGSNVPMDIDFSGQALDIHGDNSL